MPQSWTTSPQESEETNTANAFVEKILKARNFDTAPEPIKKERRRLTYRAWTNTLLSLIGGAVRGLTLRRQYQVPWKENQLEIDKVQPGLAETLWTWRKERCRQLSPQRFDALGDEAAKAWGKWAKLLQAQVTWLGEHEGIVQAAAAVVGPFG